MNWHKPKYHDLSSTLCRFIIAGNVTFASMLVLLDLMAQVSVLPQMQGFFVVDYTRIIWLARGFLFFSGIATLATGHLGAKYGHKKIFLGGNLLYLVSGLLSGLAPEYWSMLFFRLIAGFGGGMMMSMSLPILKDTFRDAEERRPVVLAYTSLSFGIGIFLGLIIGGYFGQMQEWQWVYWILFYLNFPCILVALLFQRDTEPVETPPFDWIGFLTLTLTFGSLLVIATQAKAEWNTLGFYSTFILFFIIVGITSFLLFIANHKCNPHALIDFELFNHRPFVIGFLSMIPVSFLVFGVTMATIGILKDNYGYQWLELGFLMAPMGLIYCIFGAIPTIFAGRVHPRNFVILGLGLIAYASFDAQFLTIQSDWKELLSVISLRSIGVALSLGPITTLALYPFSGELYEKGAQTIQFVRMMGACLGSSFIQLVSAYRTPFHALRFGEQVDPQSPAFQYYLFDYSKFAGETKAVQEIRTWIINQAEISGILDAEFLIGILIAIMLSVFLLSWIVSLFARDRRVADVA